ncbi:flavin reductase family protein [Candidatus Gracilibacteria bacterium]|nr:flavin reductase family protein [Candidatus Gracilibacteria bacterium]
MEINPNDIDQRDVYKLLIGSVVPRPIAWVATQDAEGRNNLAPFSFFNAIGSNPPALTVSINHAAARVDGRKDTLSNILETGEFVVNIVTEDTVHAMNETAIDYPAGVDEFVQAGLDSVPSLTVRPLRVAASPVNFECTLFTSVPIGSGPGSTILVVGLIKHIHIRDDLLDERYRIDIERLRPVAALPAAATARCAKSLISSEKAINRTTNVCQPLPYLV